jgi:hypothetical protein
MKINIGFICIILACILIALYLIWCTCINIENWSVPLTRWENVKLFKEPLLYLASPSVILILIYILLNKK